jgi:hypothetical protein
MTETKCTVEAERDAAIRRAESSERERIEMREELEELRREHIEAAEVVGSELRAINADVHYTLARNIASLGKAIHKEASKRLLAEEERDDWKRRALAAEAETTRIGQASIATRNVGGQCSAGDVVCAVSEKRWRALTEERDRLLAQHEKADALMLLATKERDEALRERDKAVTECAALALKLADVRKERDCLYRRAVSAEARAVMAVAPKQPPPSGQGANGAAPPDGCKAEKPKTNARAEGSEPEAGHARASDARGGECDHRDAPAMGMGQKTKPIPDGE